MPNFTPNLNLKKPEGSDFVLIGDLNGNMDVVDTTVGKLADLNTADKTNLVAAINEANQSGANAPYIGENGNWYEWDATTVQYVDTGVAAHGDTGDAAGFGTPTATASGLVAGETPTVTIVASGTDIAKIFAFAFGIPKGDTGDAAGFGTPVASASPLSAGSDPTVTIRASGSDVAKVFNFAFGIPKGDQGDPGTGNNWYVGTNITGTSTAPQIYATGIENAQIGDMYLNNGSLPNTGRAYVCTLGGNAATALWKYSCLLRGADGQGTGDMLKSTYDSDSDGIVDDSEKLGGNLPAWYQQSTDGLTAETALVDADTLPFFDVSASAGRKTTWSNLRGVLKTYFDALYTATLLLLTGYTKPAQSAAVAATDSIIAAIGKLERGLDDKAASKHASQHGENGSDAISPADIGAAVPATDFTANLVAASWAGASAPYTQTVSGLSGVTSDSKLDIGLAETATDAQYAEAIAAQIRATGSGTGTVTFKAHGTKPTSVLPILIRMVD